MTNKRYPNGRFVPMDQDYKQKLFDAYNEGGKELVKELFPDASFGILWKKKYKHLRTPRQIRWTDEQLIEIARMGGIISFEAQARYFNRPRAGAISILSVWNKRFNVGPMSINGLTDLELKPIVRLLKGKYAMRDPVRVRYSANKTTTYGTHRGLYLWVDIADAEFKPNIPPQVRDAFKTLAEYQRWLFQTKDVRARVLQMIEEREIKDG